MLHRALGISTKAIYVMNHYFKNRQSGRVLYVEGQFAVKANRGQLFISEDGGKRWTQTSKIGYSLGERIAVHNRLISRLFRLDIHHVAVKDSGELGLIVNKKTGVLSQNKIIIGAEVKGSRPLSLAEIDGEFVFGEYRSNPERSHIGIYGFNEHNNLHKKAELTGIRHIHGIYKDNYTNDVWITTGDNDDEAAIYRTTANFEKFHKILSGSQQTRAIKLLFDDKYIYYGSDAPDEVNHLYRMNRSTHEVKKLAQVGSSVFHGYKVGNWFFFSTAIEPSNINTTKSAEIWASPEGSEWKCIFRIEKDSLPMRYFQYGQVFFPSGPGDGRNLWLSPFGTKYDGNSFSMTLEQIWERFEEVHNV